MPWVAVEPNTIPLNLLSAPFAAAAVGLTHRLTGWPVGRRARFQYGDLQPGQTLVSPKGLVRGAQTWPQRLHRFAFIVTV